MNAPGAAAEGALWTQKPALTTVNLLLTLGLVSVGRVLAGRPGQRGTGVALILSGLASAVGWAAVWPSGPLPWLSAVLGDADSVLGAWALLRYPDPRLQRPARLYLAALAAWLIGGPAVLSFLGGPASLGQPTTAWWPPSLADGTLFNPANRVFAAGAAVLAAGFLVLLARRAVTGSLQDRAVRLPVAVAGIVAAVAAAITTIVTVVHGPSYTAYIINGMAELGVPVAFLVAFGLQGQRQLVLEKLQLAEEKTELSRRLLTAEYDTRERIAKDIHDGVQLDLQALLRKLAAISDAGEDLRRALGEAVALANQAVTGLHDFVHDVYPVTLRGSGLKATVVEMISQLDLLIRMSVLDERLPANAERAFYFVIREAVTNIVKHADATTVDIIVQGSGDRARLRIRDDGHGGADLSGTGIANMRDRIEALGGTLSIDSPAAHGTRIEAEIPCA